ncbi:MAG: c-type cytochrome [Sulfurimonas sp.]|nr:c-type cytochrome [Sulfurimonas sp.]
MKIIILVAVALFLLGCSDDGSKSSTKQEVAKEPAVEVAPVVVEVVADENAQVIQEESTEVVEVAQVIATKSGADLFKVCSSCHGANGEKKALNKSKIIQGWSEVQVSTALNGYKDGSYGGAMKGLMKSQVTKLSDEDIEILAKHISGL